MTVAAANCIFKALVNTDLTIPLKNIFFAILIRIALTFGTF